MNIVDLIVLALAAAVYPTLLAGVILILGRPNPLRMLSGFMVGALTISIVAGLLIVQGIESSGAVSKSNHSTKPGLDIAIGVLSLLVAWGVWSGRITGGFLKRRKKTEREEAAKKPSVITRALSSGSVTLALVAGVVLNLPGVWYLDALAEIAKAKPSTAIVLLDILLFNVIALMLLEIPVVAYLVDPSRAQAMVTSLRDWAHRHSRTIGIVVAAAVGVYLVTKGIIALT